MKPNPKHPWCIRCRFPMRERRTSQTDGGREFQCSKCGRSFYENSRRNRAENKIQDARWLLAAGLSQREVGRRLKCNNAIVKKAVERYGKPEATKNKEVKRPVPSAMSECWPYGETDPLVTLVNNAVPRDIPEEVRQEVGQNMLLAVFEVLANPQRFIRRYFTSRPYTVPLKEETERRLS